MPFIPQSISVNSQTSVSTMGMGAEPSIRVINLDGPQGENSIFFKDTNGNNIYDNNESFGMKLEQNGGDATHPMVTYYSEGYLDRGAPATGYEGYSRLSETQMNESQQFGIGLLSQYNEAQRNGSFR